MAQTEVPAEKFRYKQGTVQIFWGAIILLLAAVAASMSPERGGIMMFFLVIAIGVGFCVTGIYRRTRR